MNLCCLDFRRILARSREHAHARKHMCMFLYSYNLCLQPSADVCVHALTHTFMCSAHVCTHLRTSVQSRHVHLPGGQ